MKVIITGAAGFIGFHLARVLAEKGFEVIGVDNLNDFYDLNLKKSRLDILKNHEIEFYNLDINQIKSLDQDADLLINLAAQAGTRIKNKETYLHSNIKGFKSILNYCDHKAIEKLIFASSSSVYDDSVREKFSEDSTKLLPKSFYGETKLENERLAKNASEGSNLKSIGLRFFSVYGPYGRPDMSYYIFTNNLIRNEPIELNNKGEMFRDFTYIDDIIDGIIKSIDLIKKTNKKFDVFNLGSGNPIKTKDVLEMLEKKLNISANIVNKQTFNESSFTHADLLKSKKLLNYCPETSFDKGLDLFIDWYYSYEKKKN